MLRRLPQVAFANRLVVNKIDTITSEQLADVIRRLRVCQSSEAMCVNAPPFGAAFNMPSVHRLLDCECSAITGV